MQRNPFAIVVFIIGTVLIWELYLFFVFLLNIDARSFNWKSLLQFIPTFAGIAGLIIFVVSKSRNEALFKAFLCLQVFTFPFWLMNVITLVRANEQMGHNLMIIPSFIIYLVAATLMFVFSLVGLWKMRRRSTPFLTEGISEDDQPSYEFAPVRNGIRFLNRLIDMLVIFMVIVINLAANNIVQDYLNDAGNGALILLEVTATLYFYLVLEGVFNTSVGKSFTNTMVVNYEGNKPGFLTAAGRTFSRLIPFEPLSFFGAEPRGWHDTLSNTYVVKRSS